MRLGSTQAYDYHTQEMPAGRRDVLLLATLILTALFLANAPWVWSLCERAADYALILLQTARAQSFDALEGPYSRFGFRHPAPTYFYWYALTSPLFLGTDTMFGAVSGSQFLLNGILLVIAVWWFLRLSRSPLAASVFFLVALTAGLSEGKDFFFDPWGPRSTVVPLLLTTLTLTAVARGMASAVFPFSIGAIFACSNHTSALVIIAPLALIAFAKLLLERRRNPRPLSRIEHWSLGGAAAITLLCSLPPMMDAMLVPGAGNLGKIFSFASAPTHEPHSFRDLLQDAALQLASPLGIHDASIAIVAAPLLLVVPWILCLRSTLPLRDVIACATGMIVMGIFSIVKVPGNLHSYLFLPLLAPSAILIASAVSVIVSSSGRLTKVINPLCKLLSCLLILYSYQTPRTCGGKYEKLLSALNLSPGTAIMVSPPSAQDWGPFATMVSLLYRQGSAPCVERQWGFMFTEAMVCQAPPTRSLVVGTKRRVTEALPENALHAGDLVAFDRTER